MALALREPDHCLEGNPPCKKLKIQNQWSGKHEDLKVHAEYGLSLSDESLENGRVAQRSEQKLSGIHWRTLSNVTPCYIR